MNKIKIKNGDYIKMTENNKLQTIEQQLVQEKNVSDNVLNKVSFKSQGNLELPNDYSQVMP